MEQKIIEILKEVLEDNTVDLNSNSENCENWDSMNQLNIALELEEEFGFSLDPNEIANLKSVKAVLSIVESKL